MFNKHTSRLRVPALCESLLALVTRFLFAHSIDISKTMSIDPHVLHVAGEFTALHVFINRS